MAPLTSSSKIHIIGSGVFGLSTALWLARSGYKDVTVFDMQDTFTSGYDPDQGIDSASADWNKIIRFSYGVEIEYQRLAFEAAGLWEEWNRGILAADEDSLPGSLRGLEERRLWFRSGMLRVSAEEGLGAFEEETLRNMEKDGLREFQFNVEDREDVEKAKREGWYGKLDPTQRKERLGTHSAVLDSTAGWVAAYRCCAWAQHLARREGVKFVLGKEVGRIIDIGSDKERPMFKTADEKTHSPDLLIVAGGGWTPSLLPEATDLLETTAGSVATIQIPRDRPDLWEKYSPENFPVFSWGGHQGKDIYSFPRDEHGAIKIGYRHTKYTNFQPHPIASVGKRISVPRTAHVTEEKETNVPYQALRAIHEHIATNLPDLLPFGLASTKLCWYTDSIDNSFVVDHVPGRKNVVVCSGGSGHGFKFLPILGREVVRILEGKGEEGPFGKMWQWRSAKGKKRNGLEEGEEGQRELRKQRMAKQSEWDWREMSREAKL